MKLELAIDPPIMNAAGMLGFAPESHPPIDLARLGAFITNPISQERRTAAQGERYMPAAGSFWLHTGHPNPGFRSALRRYTSRWQRSALPVFVHLLCHNPANTKEMAARLENLAGVAGIELGLPPEVRIGHAVQHIRQASGELPLIVRLPFERALELASGILAQAEKDPEGLDLSALAAFSLGPPRGSIGHPGQGIVSGRMYGPAVFPMALAAVQALQPLGLPVIGAGGVYRQSQVELMLAAGALAVQLDAVLWRNGWPASK